MAKNFNEYKTAVQSNYSYPESFNATFKAPVIAKRIWATYADALGWINDPKDNAVVGLQISIINDPDHNKNGIYMVTKIGEGAIDDAGNYIGGELEKVGSTPVLEDQLGWKTIRIELDNFLENNQLLTQKEGLLSNLDLDNEDFNTTDICIGGYYPTKKLLTETGAEFYYYIEYENKINRITFSILNDKWLFCSESAVMSDADFRELFEQTEQTK